MVNSRKQNGKRKSVMAKIPDLFCLLIAAVILAGCTGIVSGTSQNADDNPEEIVYNGFSSQWIQDGKDYVSFYTAEKMALYEKKTGNVYDFRLNPFTETGSRQIVFPVGDGFWFMEIEGSDYVVKHYDKKFNEKQLYEIKHGYSLKNRISGDTEGDTLDFVSRMEAIDHVPVQFIVVKKQLLYLSGSGIWKHDLQSGNEEPLVRCNYASPYLSYMGGELYYLDSDYILKSYNIDTGNITDYPDIITEQYVISGNGIVFNNLMDQRELYWFNFETEACQKLNIGASDAYDLEKDILYYVDAGKLCWKRLGSEEFGILKEVPPTIFSLKKISGMNLAGYVIVNQNNDMEAEFEAFD